MANYRMILVIIAIAIYVIRGMESAKKDELAKNDILQRHVNCNCDRS